MRYTSIQQIKSANRSAGKHFFDEAAMKFFNSRVLSELFGPEGDIFITSEKCDVPYYPSVPRYYTVRQILEDGSVIDLSEFQEFGSSAAAKSWAKKYTEAKNV
jgi:hypothetical protein